MFPHKFDRYNIFHFIAKSLFDCRNISQDDFKKLTGLSQPTISNITNMARSEKLAEEDSYNKTHQPINKRTLNKFCDSLSVGERQKYALVWLLQDGSPNLEMRKTILEMLDDIANIVLSKSSIKEIEVDIAGTKGLFDSKSAKDVFSKQSEALQKRLHQMSAKSGHRMVVSKFPTSATHPNDVDKRLPLEGKFRRIKFYNNISKKGWGERHIHSRLTLKRYLNENSDCSLLKIGQRREHIKILIETLKNTKYPNFEVGLADNEPEIELAMRSIDVVGISTTAREILLSKDPFACGPSYLFIHDKMTVLSCFLDFEREWANIPQEFREKESVIKWLEETLAKSVKQKRRESDISPS
jgi:hypothetical protein